MDIRNSVTTSFNVEDTSSGKIFDMADAFKTAVANAQSLGNALDNVSRLSSAYATNLRSMDERLSSVSTLSKKAQNSLKEMMASAKDTGALSGVDNLTASLNSFSTAVASRKSSFTDVSRALSDIIVQGDKAQQMFDSLGTSVSGIQQKLTLKAVAGTTLTPDISQSYASLKSQLAQLESGTGVSSKDTRQQIIETKTQLALLAEEYDAYSQKAAGSEGISASFIRQSKNIKTLTEYVQQLNALYAKQQSIIKGASSTEQITAAYRTQLEVQKEIESVMQRVKKIQSGTVPGGDSGSGSILSFLSGRNAAGIQNFITNISKLGVISPTVARLSSVFSLLNTTLTGTTGVMATLGVMGIGSLILGLGKLTIAAVKAASAFQEYRVTLEALSTKDWSGNTNNLGAVMGVGSAVFSGGIEYAAKTGYNIDKVSSALERLVGYGIDMRAVNGEMEMLGNLALGSSKRLENLAVAYGQVFGQGKARAQEMYQFINAGIPIFDLLAKKLGKNTSDIMDMTRKGEVSFDMIRSLLKDMTSEGGRYADIMERITNMSFGKQQERFSTEIRMLLANIGDTLLPSVTSLLREVNNTLDRFNRGLSNSNLDKALKEANASGSGAAVSATLSSASATQLANYDNPAVSAYRLLQGMNSSGFLSRKKGYEQLSAALNNAAKQPDELSAVLEILPQLYGKKAQELLANSYGGSSFYGEYPKFLARNVPLPSVRTNTDAVKALQNSSEYLTQAGVSQDTLIQLIVKYLIKKGALSSSALSVMSSSNAPKTVFDISKVFSNADLSTVDIYQALKGALAAYPNALSNSNVLGGKAFSTALVRPYSELTTRQTLEEQRRRGVVDVTGSGVLDEDKGTGSATSKLAAYNKELRDTAEVYVGISPLMQEFIKIQELYNTDLATAGGLQEKNKDKTAKSVAALKEMEKQLNPSFDTRTVADYDTMLQMVTADLKKARTEALTLFQAQSQLKDVQKTFASFSGSWDPFRTMFGDVGDIESVRNKLVAQGVAALQAATGQKDAESTKRYTDIVNQQVTLTENLSKVKVSASDAAKSMEALYKYVNVPTDKILTVATAMENIDTLASAMGEDKDKAKELLQYVVDLGVQGTVSVDAYVKKLNELKKAQKDAATGQTAGQIEDYWVTRAASNATGNTPEDQRALIKSITGISVSTGSMLGEAYSSRLSSLLDQYNAARDTLKAASPGSDQFAEAAKSVRQYEKELSNAAVASNALSEGGQKLSSTFSTLSKDTFTTTFKTLAESLYDGTDAVDNLATAFEKLASTFLDNVSSVLIDIAASMAKDNPWMALALLAAAGLGSFVSGIMSSASSKKEDAEDDSYLKALQNLQDQLDTFMDQFRDTLSYVDQARREYIAAQQLATVGKYAAGDSFTGGTSLSEGVYTQPTLFAYAKGDTFGVMAEVPGSAEAVMPLSRGADGKLGVKATGGAAGVSVQIPVQIINNTSSDVSAQEQIAADGSRSLQVSITSAMQKSVAQGSLDSILAARYGVRFGGIRR